MAGADGIPVDDEALAASARLSVPTYRFDVRRPCDVVEEVLRVYGYNNVEISDTVHSSLQYKSLCDTADDLRRLISEQLTALGFNEILNNSLTSENYYKDLASCPADHCVKLLNPLSTDLDVMRQTLLFGGLESICHNINRRAADLAMYEFGNFRNANWARAAQPATYFDLKACVENLLMRLGLWNGSVRLETLPAAETPDIFGAAQVVKTRSGKVLGHLGTVARRLLAASDIKQEVFYAELDWNELVRLAARPNASSSAMSSCSTSTRVRISPPARRATPSPLPSRISKRPSRTSRLTTP